MLHAFLPGLFRLFAPVDDEGGGGGGGSGSGGTDDGAGGRQNGPGGEGATGTGVTETRVNEIVTKAVTRLLKTSEEKQSRALETAIGNLRTSLSETVASAITDLKDTLKPQEGSAKPAQLSTEEILKHPEFARVSRQATQAKEELEQIRKEKAEADARAKAANLRDKATEAFTKHGVDPKRIKVLTSAMIADGALSYDDDGKIMFSGADGAEELDRGVKSWVTTDEGKSWLPARGVSGSGDSTRKTTGNGAGARLNGGASNGGPSDAELANALAGLVRG